MCDWLTRLERPAGDRHEIVGSRPEVGPIALAVAGLIGCAQGRWEGKRDRRSLLAYSHEAAPSELVGYEKVHTTPADEGDTRNPVPVPDLAFEFHHQR